MASAAQPIPTIYRVFFIYIDPLIAGSGVFLDFFDPETVIRAGVPPSISQFNPFQHFLTHQLGGALSMCIILDLFLLRRTNEVWIWKVQQAGQLVWDLVMLWSTWYALRQQERLDLQKLRGEDWGNIVIVAVCTLMRTAFLLNFGFGKARKGSKRS